MDNCTICGASLKDSVHQCPSCKDYFYERQMERKVRKLEREHNKANLGYATNQELLDELIARIEVSFPGGLEYKTVGGEEIAANWPHVKEGTVV